MAKPMQAEEVLVDRTGQFEHPVLISLMTTDGRLTEQLCCRICATLSEPISTRETAVVKGATCPLCNAELSPA